MASITLSDISQKLTVEVINKAYSTRTRDQGPVQSITITRATATGQGLLSAIYRIEASGVKQKTSFIAKAMVKDEILKRALRSATVFQREVFFFSTVLPIMSEFQKSMKAFTSIQDIVPVCYNFYCDDEDGYILMEDLAEGIDRGNQLVTAKEYQDRILWMLGHFHSVSIVLKYENPHMYKSVADELFETYFVEENRSWYKKYLQRAIDINEKAISEYLEKTNVYYKKFIETTAGDVYGEMIRLACTSQSEHSVILHGDAWMPNFYITDNRTASMDFQLLRDGSPALDLTYFTIICKSDTINKHVFDESVNLYYDSLTYHIADMGFDIGDVYPRAYLDTEILKFGKFGYLCSLTTIPLISGTAFSDVFDTYAERYKGVDRIPLDDIWRLKPLQGFNKILAVNTLKVAVDVGLI